MAQNRRSKAGTDLETDTVHPPALKHGQTRTTSDRCLVLEVSIKGKIS